MLIETGSHESSSVGRNAKGKRARRPVRGSSGSLGIKRRWNPAEPPPYLILLCLLSFFLSLSMSILARRRTSVISASMDMGTGEEPRGWPGAGLAAEVGKSEREESRVTWRRRDSFMASLSRSLDLEKKGTGYPK